MSKIRPLLKGALTAIRNAEPNVRGVVENAIATRTGGAHESASGIPVVLNIEGNAPHRGENWQDYKTRVSAHLTALDSVLTGGIGTPIYSANAIATELQPKTIERVAESNAINSIELDPLVDVATMDDAVLDIDLATFQASFGTLRGAGVRVAVLDSGVDVKHPFLSVSDSISTCGEDVAIPGAHGTHCAGSLASRDAIFAGIAPDVTLINIKVMKANNRSRSTWIQKGIDAALDREADILSMSLGFNHLPAWSHGGHGWACPDGTCELCTAVGNAVFFGATVIVAAGNEHERAEALRNLNYDDTFDTELGCPGQASRAITVGAITKRTFEPASFSSRGPSSYGTDKPDLVGPGVNVMSCAPVPRDAAGNVTPCPQRSDLFVRQSGTSMATPIVAGVAALVIEDRRSKGLAIAPEAVRAALFDAAIVSLERDYDAVGRGRIALTPYGIVL